MAEKKTKYFYRIKDLPVVMLTEKSKSHMVVGTNVLLSFIENPPGCVFPLHNHPSIRLSRFSSYWRERRITFAGKKSF
ncbi:MAG: hypothetical protein ABSH06_10765 [Thermodesulfobacteriota bacterium]